MSTPFKMKPGRGDMPKTGRGLAPTLMCGSPMKQEDPSKKPGTNIELTAKFGTGKNKMANARQTPGKIANIEATQGIKVDPMSGSATVKSYEKKFIPGDMAKGVRAKIVSGTGELIKEAKIGEDNRLKSEYEREKAYTASTRGTNASQYNITSGSKSTNKATEREKQMLINIGKAKKA
jgi:hypothetical protein